MVQLFINGIEVEFPYEPYPVQIRYMSQVIQSLRSGQNALLESPTGTGKTLCLLCATLAWRSVYIAALQAHVRPGITTSATEKLKQQAGLRTSNQPNNAIESLTALVRPDASTSHLSTPRIVFCSRTHTQLAQAINELKKTSYHPSMSLLASRDQLCIHPISSSYSGARLNAKCRRLTAPNRRQCRFHLPVASARRHENRREELVEKMQTQPPMDIEDARSYGMREGACPWFLARAAARSDECHILFLPYNYLLDPDARSSLEIDWTNDILIIDEAHNLESFCCDVVGFDFTANMRESVNSELIKLVQDGMQPGGLNIPALEQLAKTEEGKKQVLGSENTHLQEISLLQAFMAELESFITTRNLDRGKDGDVSFAIVPGPEFRKLLQTTANLSVETYDLYVELLESFIGVQADSKEQQRRGNEVNGNVVSASTSSSGTSALKILQSAIRSLFESLKEGDEQFFRTVIHQQRNSQARTLSYWCFNPANALRRIQRLNLRCMMLTSGTLSPMDSFAAELDTNFPVRLENPHVVTAPQIWAGVLKSGPGPNGLRGGRLTSAFYARGEESDLELGRSLIQLATVIPDGMLVFFPSYSSLYSSLEVWKRLGPGPDRGRPSIWEHLQRRKRIVAEERDSSAFAAAILAHKANVDAGNGSMLLAVCRGKVSEGIDFSDQYGRAVIITGLPYPSAFDPRVVLKREIADEQKRLRQAPSHLRPKGVGDKKKLSGSEWYSGQAMRAVNQAVGRAIRHRFDYGAIILCEERFQAKALQDQISKWIRPNITLHNNFNGATASISEFFTAASNSEFARLSEAQQQERKRREKETVSQKNEPEGGMEAVRVAQETISHLMPPPKTEKQFLQQIMAFTEEAKVPKSEELSPDISPPVKVLDFSTQNAHGGLHDSGSLRIASGPRIRSLNGQKRTATFLAARAEKIDSSDEEGIDNGKKTEPNRQKRKLDTPASTPRPNTQTSGDKEKMSDKVKRLFSKREHTRVFLDYFRKVMVVGKRLREGTGPVQSSSQQRMDLEEGKQLTHKLVEFARSQNDQQPEEHKFFVETFLVELREKIAVPLRSWYDDALERGSGMKT